MIRKRVMVKVKNRWIRGKDDRGHTSFYLDTAKRVLASARAHGHSAYIAEDAPKSSREEKLRAAIVSHAKWGCGHEPQIHYSQGPKRMDAIGHPRHLPLHTDCSAFVTLCYNWAGAGDPNGRWYDGTGYTGSLLEHCVRIGLDDVRPGDLVVYGEAPGVHVCVVDEPGADPWLVSHGQERGPFRVRHSVEARAHGGARVTWLTLPAWSA